MHTTSYGHAGVDPEHGRRRRAAQGFGGFADAFGDIFGDIFGQRRRRRRARPAGPQVYRGADLRYNLEITLEQAAHGFDTQIRVPCWDELRHLPRLGRQARYAAGNLSDLSAGRARCACRRAFSASSRPARNATAPAAIIPEPCTHLPRRGQVKETKTLEVKIPAGIDDGMRIRSSGNGEPGINGGPSGRPVRRDSYQAARGVRARWRRSALRDADFVCQGGARAAKSKCRRSRASACFTVPEGTQSGKTFRLRGKGIKGVRSSYRRRFVLHVQVETPVKLTDQQRDLLKQFEKSLTEGGARHSPQSKSWFDRVKSFFD